MVVQAFSDLVASKVPGGKAMVVVGVGAKRPLKKAYRIPVKEGSVPWTGGSIGTEKSSILHALDCMSNLQHPTKPTCAMAVGSWQLRPTGDFPPPTHY